MNSDDNGSTYM